MENLTIPEQKTLKLLRLCWHEPNQNVAMAKTWTEDADGVSYVRHIGQLVRKGHVARYGDRLHIVDKLEGDYKDKVMEGRRLGANGYTYRKVSK